MNYENGNAVPVDYDDPATLAIQAEEIDGILRDLDPIQREALCHVCYPFKRRTADIAKELGISAVFFGRACLRIKQFIGLRPAPLKRNRRRKEPDSSHQA